MLIKIFLISLFLLNVFARDLKWQRTSCGSTDQITQWGKTINASGPILPEYPRPQLVRGDNDNWINLNGLWEFEGSDNEKPIKFGQSLPNSILVPFPAESCLSGVGQTYKHLQYRTTFSDFSSRDKSNTRVLLHFGAIDWQSSIYVNNVSIGNNTGGYNGFTFDITQHLNSENASDNELYVKVFDPSDDGVQPNGKQRISAITDPGGDTYTPSSGIWQTIWLEQVPLTHISKLKLWADLKTLYINVGIDGSLSSDSVTIKVMDNTNVVATANGKTNQTISISIPSPKLWSPTSPFLYNLQVTLNSGDTIESYFGMRTYTLGSYVHPGVPDTGPQQGIDRSGDDISGYPIELNEADYNLCWNLCNTTSDCLAWAYAVPNCDTYTKPMCWLKNARPATSSNTCRVSGAKQISPFNAVRPLLNNNPIYLAGWLDQSFWPDGIYTAPNDDALKYDITSLQRYGLNFVRLHQKVNSERWYYYTDKLGIIVWQDMIQKYGGATSDTIPYFMNDLNLMIEHKYNHPSIVQWEVFNEEDCVDVFPNVSAVIEYVRKLDPTRLIDTDSGGPANNLHIGDVNDLHTYPYPGDPIPSATQYGALGEFGGIGAFVSGKEWVSNGCTTYKQVDTPSDEANLYIEMTETILSEKYDISASVYTQITDVEEECDGFMNYDRTDKFDSTDLQNVYEANQKLIYNMTNR